MGLGTLLMKAMTIAGTVLDHHRPQHTIVPEEVLAMVQQLRRITVVIVIALRDGTPDAKRMMVGNERK